MALRATPTIAICLTFGVASGIALARPADQADPAASAAIVEPASAVGSQDTSGDPDSPYLADGTAPPAAVGDDTTAVAGSAAPAAISIEGFAFSSSGPVAAGSTITITNLDSSPHTLTAVDGAFDTGTLGQGESVTITAPTTPGTYEFFCEIHPGMTGQLVVS